ncbi:MAG: nitrile hydratase accessory protein [Paracoccaceae bacterium]
MDEDLAKCAGSEPPFSEPWHAQIFALTLTLSEAGLFTWAAWTDAFGATLKRHGAGRALDGSADYYAAWLETLEAVLETCGHVGAKERAQIKAAWEAAYLATPHGQPVHLAD